MRPYADRHGLTLLQLACQWNLAHPAVRCVAPTLIQESAGIATAQGQGQGQASQTPETGVPKPIEDKRAELASLPKELLLSEAEIAELRAIGDNSGSMVLKGASVEYEGEQLADRWQLDEQLGQLAARWEIAPQRDLVKLG